MTTTPNYSFTLPTVGGNVNQWGLLLNNNWSALDTALFNLNNNLTTSTSGVVVSNTVASGYRAFYAETSGQTRWAWGANADAETGSNAGSSFFLNAYTDGGGYIDSPISIARAAGGTIIISRPTSLPTGSTAVTQSSSDNSTNIATTAFANTAASNAETAAIAAALQAIYPVGSLYFNASVATNPATLLGFGTWTAYAQGRAIVGVGTGTDINSHTQTFTLGETTGEYTHTLTTPEMPSHTHNITQGVANIGASGYGLSGSGNINIYNPLGTQSTGGGGAHNNVQPVIALYIWQRTA